MSTTNIAVQTLELVIGLIDTRKAYLANMIETCTEHSYEHLATAAKACDAELDFLKDKLLEVIRKTEAIDERPEDQQRQLDEQFEQEIMNEANAEAEAIRSSEDYDPYDSDHYDNRSFDHEI